MSNGSAPLPFFLGVQFHPERLAKKHSEHQAIFNRFVEACSQGTNGALAKTRARTCLQTNRLQK
jgi:hypothetical protein